VDLIHKALYSRCPTDNLHLCNLRNVYFTYDSTERQTFNLITYPYALIPYA